MSRIFCDREHGGCTAHVRAAARQAWCYHQALEHVGGDRNTLADLACTFQEVAPSRLGTLSTAAANGDGARLRHVAHDLATLLGMIGAPNAAEAASRVERDAERGDVDAACESSVTLRHKVTRVLEALGRREWKRAA